MKLSVAAVPYFWSKEAYQDFYRALVKTNVSIIYIGETVCSKRRSMTLQDWIEIAEMITAHGKQAVLSTLTLLEAESELKYLSKIVGQKEYLIEANDLAAIQLASQNKLHFVAGTAVNIYNQRTLSRLAKQGMKRWVVPVELGRGDLPQLISTAALENVEVEYQVFGRMPLAHSARCFTARHLKLPKDNCRFKCLEYEQGIKVKTQEGDSFAYINGIQTQSAKVSNLLNRFAELSQLGIDVVRIVPVSREDTIKVVALAGKAVSDNDTVNLSPEALSENYEYCNGYWLNVEGMTYVE